MGKEIQLTDVEKLIKELNQAFVQKIFKEVQVPSDLETDIPDELRQELEEKYGVEGAKKFDYIDVTGLITLLGSEKQTRNYINNLLQQLFKEYIKLEVLQKIVEQAQFSHVSTAIFNELLEQLLSSYYYYRFAYSLIEEPFHLCDCEEAPLEKRIIAPIFLVDQILTKFPPEQFKPWAPLIYTSFASGGLLQEILNLQVLARWYSYITINFIDELYPEALQEIKQGRQTILDHCFKELLKSGLTFLQDSAVQEALEKVETRCYLRTFSSGQEYIKSIQEYPNQRPHILTTVDLGQEGYWWFLQEEMQITRSPELLRETTNAAFFTYGSDKDIIFACYFNYAMPLQLYVLPKAASSSQATAIQKKLEEYTIHAKKPRITVFDELYSYVQHLGQEWNCFWVSYPYLVFQEIIKYAIRSETVILQLSQNKLLLVNPQNYTSAHIVDYYAGAFLRSQGYKLVKNMGR